MSVYLNVAKVMKISASRRQGCSCSGLPQNLENEEDGIFMTFPKGKNFGGKKMNLESHFWCSPDVGLKSILFILNSNSFIFF